MDWLVLLITFGLPALTVAIAWVVVRYRPGKRRAVTEPRDGMCGVPK